MLPKTFRFIAVNNTGVEMHYNTGCRLAVTYDAWKFDSNGALSYRAEVATALNTFGANETIADGAASDVGATQDNSSNLDLGVLGTFEVIHASGTANGTVDLYYELSTDGGTDWPTTKPEADVEDDCIFLGSIQYATASGQRATNFEI